MDFLGLDPQILKLGKVFLCGILGVILMETLFTMLGLSGVLIMAVAIAVGALIGAGVGIIWVFKKKDDDEEEE